MANDAIDLVSISEEVKVGGMTINQLYDICLDALDRGDRVIVLVTDWVRLLKTRGPIGELRCVNAQGKKVVAFNAEKVLEFCKKEMSGK